MFGSTYNVIANFKTGHCGFFVIIYNYHLI